MGTHLLFVRFVGRCVRQGALIGAALGAVYAVIMAARSAIFFASVGDDFANAPIYVAPGDVIPVHLLILGGLLFAVLGAIGGVCIGLVSSLAMYSALRIVHEPTTGVRMSGWLLPAIGTAIGAIVGWIGTQLLVEFGDPGDVAMWWYQVASNPFDAYTMFNVIIGHIFFVQMLPIILTALGGWIASRRVAEWYAVQHSSAAWN